VGCGHDKWKKWKKWKSKKMEKYFCALIVALGLALGLAMGTSSTVHAQASLAGTWELDRFKSVYEPVSTQPQRRVLVVEVKGDDISTRTQTWRGDALNEVMITAKLDGRDYPVPNQTAVVAFRRLTPSSIQRTAKLDGKIAETQTWTLSADGKVLTIAAEGTDSQGTPLKSKQHYDKK
jgi:hypothetical protein